MCTRNQAEEILHSVYHACSPIFGRIHDAYLYGSYARGDFNSESDIDILLTVDLEQAEIAKHRNDVAKVTSRLSLEHDITVSVRQRRHADFLGCCARCRITGMSFGRVSVMQEHERKALSQARLEHAVECLSAARNLLETGNYKSAANRSYYAVFHAMRAVLAFDEIDMKRHSGVISEFRRRYIKTEIFETRMSEIISILFDVRTDSDYDDFFVISKADTAVQIENAAYFVDRIAVYLKSK